MAMRQVRPAGKPALDLRSVKARYSGNYQQILTQLLQQKDSLMLTAVQIDSASKLFARFNVLSDSIFDPLAKYLLDAPRMGSEREVGRRITLAQHQVLLPLCDLLEAVRGVLTADQRKKLKVPLSYELDLSYIGYLREQAAKPVFFGF
jgi:hypothetical protein